MKIEHLLDRKPGQLSGGQRQRVALGRAMVRKPAAFLMDEPLSNLDAALRVHMRAELADLHRSIGTTFIYVTHDQAEALTMSDRMAVMMDGRILQVGEPNDVYQDPDNLRVAEFIGSPKINILPSDTGSGGRLSCLGVGLPQRLTEAPGGEVSLGFRPEHLELRSGQGDDSFAGRLVHKENLGSDIFLHVAVGDGAHRIVVRAQPSEAHDLPIGADLWIACSPGKAMAFGRDGWRLAIDGETKTKKQVA